MTLFDIHQYLTREFVETVLKIESAHTDIGHEIWLFSSFRCLEPGWYCDYNSDQNWCVHGVDDGGSVDGFSMGGFQCRCAARQTCESCCEAMKNLAPLHTFTKPHFVFDPSSGFGWSALLASYHSEESGECLWKRVNLLEMRTINDQEDVMICKLEESRSSWAFPIASDYLACINLTRFELVKLPDQEEDEPSWFCEECGSVIPSGFNYMCRQSKDGQIFCVICAHIMS